MIIASQISLVPCVDLP